MAVHSLSCSDRTSWRASRPGRDGSSLHPSLESLRHPHPHTSFVYSIGPRKRTPLTCESAGVMDHVDMRVWQSGEGERRGAIVTYVTLWCAYTEQWRPLFRMYALTNRRATTSRQPIGQAGVRRGPCPTECPTITGESLLCMLKKNTCFIIMGNTATG